MTFEHANDENYGDEYVGQATGTPGSETVEKHVGWLVQAGL